ncbi:hypothetical protein FOH38_01865 [Lysinibacillus fusiformis]|nr:hypothetical protein FOH38_01865 [Lysinibacillus fusiformis]
MNAEMLEKRIEILQKIDNLQSKCHCQTAHESESCSNCKKIAKYGQKLLCLVNKRNIKILDLDDIQVVKRTKLSLTKEKYLAFKRVNKTDREIAQICNVSPGTIKNWKIANNIVTERVIRRRYNVR